MCLFMKGTKCLNKDFIRTLYPRASFKQLHLGITIYNANTCKDCLFKKEGDHVYRSKVANRQDNSTLF